jgi:uncharacterized protein YjbI with pentapeptide repeats
MSSAPNRQEDTPEEQNVSDDSEPTSERQAELREASKANSAAGNPPYAGVAIASRGELLWIVGELERNTAKAGRPNTYPDLRGAGFGGDLRNIALTFANLSGAWIQDADFRGADLTFANLSGAFILDANFAGVGLTGANLSSAQITDSDFGGAILTGADMTKATTGESIGISDFGGADMRFVNLSAAAISGNLQGADLTSARLDAATVLGGYGEHRSVRLDAATRLLDVSWNGANLSLVDWATAPRLGDEASIKEAETRKERAQAYQDAARAYRGLAKALESQGLADAARRYRTRQYQLERGGLLRSFRLGQWIFSWLLNIVSGYGDKPGRALAVYLVVIAAFAGVNFAITDPVSPIFFSGSQQLQWHEAVILSLSSFHGRGFFPQGISLGDPAAIVAAIEAVIGLFVELVLIATFTQRFFTK